MDDKSEPRENDKCMDQQGDSTTGGMSKLRAQVTSAVANIPSLVIVLLCVLLLVFFVIIVALSVKVHSGSTAPDDRCLSAACLGSAARVLAGLREDIAPCQDPYAMSCRPGVPRRQHAVRHLVDLVPFDGDQASAELKAKRFYETCMEPRSLSQDALALLNYRLRQVGGWELVASSSWSLQSWDRDTALEKLHVDLGVSPFFAVGVADRTIRLEPSGFTFPSYEYYADGKPDSFAGKVLGHYRELIEHVSSHLRDGPPTLANSVLADTIINYERRLLERLRPRENVTETDSLRTTVAQLTRLVPIVKWEQLLSAYFHGHSIGQDTPVLIVQPHYFNGLSQIISTTDTTTLNHYMMWRLVMKYAPHLDKTVRSEYFRFQRRIFGDEKPEEEWWEQCTRHTSHYLRHAVGYLYATRAAGNRVQDTIQQAEALAERVKTSAIESVGEVAWLPEKGPLREKLTSLDFRVGYAFKDKPGQLDQFYLDLVVKLGSHLENVFEAERFLGRKKALMLNNRALLKEETAEDEAWTISAVDTQPTYNRELNTVVVPLAALRPPIFSLDDHPALQYGSFGSLMGRLVFEFLRQEGGNLFRNNATRASLQEKLHCLANRYHALNSTLPVNGLLVAPEALADLAGVTAAFRAFESDSHGKEKLPGMEWTAQQIFFIGYAQSMCEEVSLRRLQIWSLVSISAPKKLRVLQALQQSPEFGRSFDCNGEEWQSHICHAW
uniref:Gluzincin n=1 Tax=Rhipicephalus zambeziensis TaxID=60191 RepID=A0A224YDT4_9ACAR